MKEKRDKGEEDVNYRNTEKCQDNPIRSQKLINSKIIKDRERKEGESKGKQIKERKRRRMKQKKKNAKIIIQGR